METNQLIAFVSLSDTMSFTKTAKKLHLTQPAVSKRIQLLEKSIDTPLFIRDKKDLYMTEAGRVLLPFAKAIVDEIQAGQEAISRATTQAKSSLSIGVGHFIGTFHIPEVLQNFCSSFGDIELRVQHQHPVEVFDTLQQGLIELSINTLSSEHKDELKAEKLWSYPLVPVVNPQHPLAKQGKVTLEELAKHKAVLASEGMPTREAIDKIFKKASVKPSVSLEINHMRTLRDIVLQMQLWTLLPEPLVDDSLVKLSVPNCDAHMDFYMIHLVSHKLSPVAAKFVELLKQSC